MVVKLEGRKDRVKSKPKAFRVAAGAAIALGFLTLTACAADADAADPASSSPTPIGNGETSTPTPETPSGLEVYYDYFEPASWDTADEDRRRQICENFYETNTSAEVVLSPQMTGTDAATWTKSRWDKIVALYKDSSDPRNKNVARLLVECLTTEHGPTEQARDYFNAQLDGIDSFGPETIPSFLQPETATKYSDGVFAATGSEGEPYSAFTVQGRASSYGQTPQIYIYEFIGGDKPSLEVVQVAKAEYLESVPNVFGPKPPITTG